MLRTIRIANFLVGVILAISVVTGVMDIELFIVPDLLLAAFLVMSSILPRRLGLPVLLAACSFATGVFTVATTRYMLDGDPINPPLLIMLAVVGVSAAILIVRLSRSISTS